MKTTIDMIPKGTTQEQWDRYHAEVREFERRMELKQIHFDQALWCLRNYLTQGQLDRCKELMSNEIAMASSCDRPNEPGYYRANND